MCLDIGNKRIGIALSDPFNTYALPYKTLHRKNLKSDLAEIVKAVNEKGVTDMVCGLPVNFDGTPSIQTERARFFIERLKEAVSLTVYEVDERCTTCEAESVLIEQGKSREERKNFVDALAATEILNGFLNEINSKKGDNMSEKEKKCACGHDHDHENCDCEHEEGCTCECCEGEDEIVELTTDDGRTLKFFIVGTIEYKGKMYSAFEPAEEIEGVSEDDLIIFELSGDDEETAELLPVEDEALLDEVFEEFCRVLEEDELAEEAENLED